MVRLRGLVGLRCRNWLRATNAVVAVVWTGSGKNKLRPVAGGRFHHSRNQTQPLLLLWRCEACGQPPTCGQGGGTARRFPRLVHRDRACAVRRASAQPTVHKFTASMRHRVTPPPPRLAQACRSRPRPVFATRVPDADGADCTSRRIRRGCAAARSHCSPDAGRPIRT